MIQRIFFALVALALVQTVYFYPQTPALVASHFDGAGQADGWSSRGGFFGLYLLMVALLVAVFFYAPRWSQRRGLKVPDAEYWLAPERIEQTRAWFRRQMLVSGIVHLLLAIGVFQLAIDANLNGPRRISSGVFMLLGAYFVFLAGWLIHFFLHWRRP